MSESSSNEIVIATEVVMNQIFSIRGCKVMMDFHLARLYQVETRVLKQAVKRKKQRFPEDLMFQLTKEEWKELITIVISYPRVSNIVPPPLLLYGARG